MKPKEAFPLKPLIRLGLDFKRMIELTRLELYKSNFNSTEEIKKLELLTEVSSGGFPYLKMKLRGTLI